MKRYPVAVLRERLSEALDAAYQGQSVFVERKGVRYRITREQVKRKAVVHAPIFEHVDAALLDGNWTWEWSGSEMAFASGPGAKVKKTKTGTR